jgi:hypothetical protein
MEAASAHAPAASPAQVSTSPSSLSSVVPRPQQAQRRGHRSRGSRGGKGRNRKQGLGQSCKIASNPDQPSAQTAAEAIVIKRVERLLQAQRRDQAKLFREQLVDYQSFLLQITDREPATASRQPSGAVEVASSALQAPSATPQQHPAPQGLPEAAEPALSPAAPVYVPGASKGKGNLPKHAAMPDGGGPVCTTTIAAVAEGVPNAAARAKAASIAARDARAGARTAQKGQETSAGEQRTAPVHSKEQPLDQHSGDVVYGAAYTAWCAEQEERGRVSYPGGGYSVVCAGVPLCPPRGYSGGYGGGGGYSGPPALGQHSEGVRDSPLQTPVRAPVEYSTPGYASPSTRFFTPASGYNPRRL